VLTYIRKFTTDPSVGQSI